MNKKHIVDFSNFSDEVLVAFATWKNGGVTPSDIIGFMIQTYLKGPILTDTAQFQKDMALIQVNAIIDANIEEAENFLVVTPVVEAPIE
jgi:hypothetical protein